MSISVNRKSHAGLKEIATPGVIVGPAGVRGVLDDCVFAIDTYCRCYYIS